MKLPDYHFISAPLWLVTVLHLLTLALHLAAMGAVFGGTLITLWASARGRWTGAEATGLIRLLPATTAATVTLGVAPLLFLQLVYPAQTYAATITIGWFWLLVPAAVIVGYYALYRASFSGHRTGKANLGALALAVAALVYVSLVYSSVFALAEAPAKVKALYAATQGGWAWNPEPGTYLVRWAHMVLGALTLGAFFVGAAGKDSPAMTASARTAFAGGMAAAAVAGVAYLMSLGPLLKPFMRSSGMIVLTVAIVLSLAALHFFFRSRLWLSGITLFLSLLGMVYARHDLRLLRLAGSFDPGTWRVAPQWSPFLLFLVCFLAMLGVLGWMVKLFLTREQPAA